MKLENVTAKIRPRGRWESIDLGCAMARKNYLTILFAWTLTVWPLWILFIVLTGLFMSPGWHLFCSVCWCWMTLSIADRVPLYIISRDLFGEKVTLFQVVAQWWKVMWRRQFFGRLMARFSSNRGLTLPVSELEGMKGARYKQRVSLLTRNGGDGATQALLISILLVFVVVCSIFLFERMIRMLYGEPEAMEMIFADLSRHGGEYALQWQILLYYLIGVTLIEPFFVGAGFAMYINSRTVTEGWDIELIFKRMSERLRSLFEKKTMALLMMLGLLFSSTSLTEANDSRVDRILKNDDFKVHRSTYKEYEESGSASKSSSSSSSSKTGGGKGGGSSKPKPAGPNTSGMFEGLFLGMFWALVALAVAGIIWVIIKNRHALKRGIKKKNEEVEAPKVKSVMGMDVTPESLPLDINEEARNAWRRGEHQLALSLLYRGAISWMVNQAHVPILESDTEEDCVLRVRSSNTEHNSAAVGYFSHLTKNWIRLAYGKHYPNDAVVMALCDDWPFKKYAVVEKKGGDV